MYIVKVIEEDMQRCKSVHHHIQSSGSANTTGEEEEDDGVNRRGVVDNGKKEFARLRK